MRTTIQEYRKRCDMNLMPIAKYDINSRVELIVQEVNEYLAECERRAREMLEYDNYNKEGQTK